MPTVAKMPKTMTMSRSNFLPIWFSFWRLCWSRLEPVIRKVSNVLSSTSPPLGGNTSKSLSPPAPPPDSAAAADSADVLELAVNVENNVNQMAAERAKSKWNTRKKTATSLTKVVKAQQHWRIRTIMVFSRVFSLSSSQSDVCWAATDPYHNLTRSDLFTIYSPVFCHTVLPKTDHHQIDCDDVKETQKHRNELKKDRPYGKHTWKNLLLLILYLLLFFNKRPSYTLHSGHRNGFLLSSAHYIRDWLTQASKPLFFATSLYCLVKICFWRLTLSAADGNVR